MPNVLNNSVRLRPQFHFDFVSISYEYVLCIVVVLGSIEARTRRREDRYFLTFVFLSRITRWWSTKQHNGHLLWRDFFHRSLFFAVLYALLSFEDVLRTWTKYNYTPLPSAEWTLRSVYSCFLCFRHPFRGRVGHSSRVSATFSRVYIAGKHTTICFILWFCLY